jgi:hypothetical protein
MPMSWTFTAKPILQGLQRVLWGPVNFIADTAPVNQITGFVLCAILVPGILAFALKPRPATAAISLLAVLLWVVFGMIGIGIHC